VIEIENLTKRFGAKTAVDRLSLTVPSGEFFAFVGPNGAGKTTTIRLIVGLLRAEEGTVRICGHDIRKESVAAKALLSHIPDEPYLYDKLSGREFLEFVARMYRMAPEAGQRRIEELSEALSLGDYLDDLAEGYSHGMKQRVVIAAALLHGPKAIVVDEPMVGLDPRSTRVVKDILRGLSKKGTTIFMSTHTLSVAEEVADRIGIIHHGRMVGLGTLEELRRASGGAAGLEESFLRLTAEEENGWPRA
jgi:ABC-2 type transport system ATP-binding protein